jgi:UDP-N-acetylglucosamine--N-acetylmuramyl-(pentapeptide) pyrophosphoryl-undecaprenol N-acetylglucosamine transferase
VGFAETAEAFTSAKAVVTGNPIRFSKLPQPAMWGAGPLRILVLGGSTGAHRLNLGVLEAIRTVGDGTVKFSIVHQTGEADAELVADTYRALGCDAQVLRFIEDVADALEHSQLVIARAGAMAVSEIAVAGRPAIFVPYPFHRDQQQVNNARVLERAGGAVIVPDDEHLGMNLARTLQKLYAKPECLQQMGRQAHKIGMPDAARDIVKLCFEILPEAGTAA